MAAVGKEAQRAELHKTIWRIANDLRGSVDGWDFKTYVLGTLFYRFISENLTAYLNEQERKAGSPDFDYAALSDAEAERGRRETVVEKGFYILPSELFANVRERARHDENLNETLAAVFRNIEGSAVGAASEHDLKGLFDDLDVNSSKLGPTVAKRNERLVKLLDAIGDLDLEHADNTIDAFGDAYEFLMTMYASSAGKSGGEFFTPQEVSELLARITVVGKTEVNKVYDPACGSGSLLLKFAKVLGRDNVRLGFFGQEINLTTYNLCRINMFLHDVNYEKFDIAHGDTLTDPQHWDDEPFEAIVSNPPYSIKWDGDANPLLINDPRFAPAGVLAPKVEGRPGLHDAHAELAGRERHCRDRRVPRRALPRRRGAEDPQVPDRQQLRRRGDPASAGSLLRHDDRDLRHRAQEKQDRQRDALHRCVQGVRPPGQQEQAHRGGTGRRSSTRSRRAPTPTTSRRSSTTARSPRTATTSRSPPTSRPRTPARPSTSRAQRRDRADRRAAGRIAEGDRRARGRPRGRQHVSRFEDLIAERCPDGVRFRALGEIAVLVRGNGMPRMDLTDEGVGAIHYGQIYTHYGAWTESTISFVAPETAARLAKVNPGDIIVTNTSENVEEVGKAVACARATTDRDWWTCDGRQAP